jgi:hypothetical protein
MAVISPGRRFAILSSATRLPLDMIKSAKAVCALRRESPAIAKIALFIGDTGVEENPWNKLPRLVKATVEI